MTDVEYTEQALSHLEDLAPQVADRVMNKVDEATEWTEHRLERLSGFPYYKLRAGDYRAIITGTVRPICPASKRSATVGTSTTDTSRRDEQGGRRGSVQAPARPLSHP